MTMQGTFPGPSSMWDAHSLHEVETACDPRGGISPFLSATCWTDKTTGAQTGRMPRRAILPGLRLCPESGWHQGGHSFSLSLT